MVLIRFFQLSAPYMVAVRIFVFAAGPINPDPLSAHHRGREAYLTGRLFLEPKPLRKLSDAQTLDKDRKDNNDVGDQHELFTVHGRAQGKCQSDRNTTS
ncbi:hypothetical protein SAMN05421827_108183 [Pedobacter terrae]|uniref:Uncharacterized protein n=1 Tax=Pedobacter terrae TaxID=405671 RepID=A0A1G7VPF9_9SPHI|nr:hypothetical protein SAMN05421827_108183 [Pedobacter terrae]